MVLTMQVSGRHSGDIRYSYSIVNKAWSIEGTWDNRPAVLKRSDL
jgi:hypothetical protein